MTDRKDQTLNDMREDAAAWVERMRSPEAHAHAADFKAWAAGDAKRLETFAGMDRAWSDPDLWAALAEEAHTAQEHVPQNETPVKTERRLRQWASLRPAFAAAASIAVVVAASAIWLARQPDRYEVAYSTPAAQTLTQVLQDGTVIELNGRTALNLSMDKASREISLERGELFLTVAKDERPLVVTIGEATAMALGTQFNVDRREAATEVSVVEGVVEVRLGEARLTLRAGDVAEIGDRLVMTERPAIATVAWKSGWLEADSMTLATLVEELNRHSHTQIRIGDTETAQLPISGRFALTDITATLSAIAAVYNLEIDRMTDAIIINSKQDL
ncbi:MAG: FecR domain-containing protein [Pseudomonadota bacterium]